jgi:hypothetical protein
VDDLRPVPKPNVGRLIGILLGLAALELGGFLAFGTTRPDIDVAVARIAFWWKIGGLGLLALLGVGGALRSFDPESTPTKEFHRWVLVLAGVLLFGFGLNFVGQGLNGFGARLMWRMGIQCLTAMTLLSVPPLIALGLMMRRGAPTDRQTSAIAVGSAASAWGAFVFAFHCPSDDPLYIIFWYTLGCTAITLLANAILPSTSRW